MKELDLYNVDNDPTFPFKESEEEFNFHGVKKEKRRRRFKVFDQHYVDIDQIVLPEDLLMAPPKSYLTGSKALVAAVLNDAIRILLTRPRETLQWKEEFDWLLSSKKEIFSFLHSCDILGLSAEAVREKLVSILNPVIGQEKSGVKSSGRQSLKSNQIFYRGRIRKDPLAKKGQRTVSR